ncbi:hypothetical protein T440DRAFT_326547 [Plenodomus tracheiphilus IPT5]|uniref:Zn(2)-C6 fungal-type domain-containing protein n=1 Tax=Plenodomus tracheiphilus IPT5 TaxID=1408161 RepID=A0A6A7AQK1_9PLEO|nr:hypothetical protein T440DRAFT_326547 [Plenodomus tracheiphilus IPT5]
MLSNRSMAQAVVGPGGNVGDLASRQCGPEASISQRFPRVRPHEYNAPHSNKSAQFPQGQPALQQVIPKQFRATQACTECRSRKQKCNQAQPCQSCADKSLECQYTSVLLPKKDRTISQIQENVDSILQSLKSVSSDLSGCKSEMTTLKQGIYHLNRAHFSHYSEHATLANKLLKNWRSIGKSWDVKSLDELLESIDQISDFAILSEQERGQLRVWGIGEGKESTDELGSPDNGDNSDVPPPMHGLWGYPTCERSRAVTPFGYSWNQGGLDENGQLDFHSRVIYELLDSYLDNLHALHPFMSPSELKVTFGRFAMQYSPDAEPLLPLQGHHGVKRKRSNNGFSGPSSTGSAIKSTINNAIVLLVLALGKVLQFDGKCLPAPRKDPEIVNDNRDQPKNIDFLPGMAYFAYATNILGNELSGNTVAHAQAMILAGLYLSQFSRVLESWSWISEACRIVLFLTKVGFPKLLRSQYPNRQAEISAIDQYRLNPLICAYWTCLQLESDILAGMSTLLPSGISEHKSNILYPTGPDTISMMILSSNLSLCISYNEANHDFCRGNKCASSETSNVEHALGYVKYRIETLQGWRRSLPPRLYWNDDESPPTNLDHAQLRAKYYGELSMMLRPSLWIATHIIGLPAIDGGYFKQDLSWTYNISRSAQASRQAYTAALTEDQRNIVDIGCQCIDAAIRSTVAFDRVGDLSSSEYKNYISTRTVRLKVTNIFGTLHAQFINMLVLTSVYKSKLNSFLGPKSPLNEANLIALFDRTLANLQENSQNSPSLAADIEILKIVQNQMDLK